ncbi:MAG: hypothetical protein R8M11_01335 [Gallionella sp.]
MAKSKNYVGIQNDSYGGMTSLGKLIRDAWVFGLLDESETCEGWNSSLFDVLLDKVNREWDKYGCLVSHLPPELFERHQCIHDKAIADAKTAGWSGNIETDYES